MGAMICGIQTDKLDFAAEENGNEFIGAKDVK